MRNFLVAKLQCAKCGTPLEIKFANEVSEAARDWNDYLDIQMTGAAKKDISIFVEPCRSCQEKLERPARKILEGLNELKGASA